MCGRYAASRRPEDLAEEFEIEVRPRALAPASFNVAPTDPVNVVVQGPLEGDKPAVAGRPFRRCLTVMRWGLVPFWARDPSIGSRMINARVETVADKPAFRDSFRTRRCLIPADGYYEWYAVRDENGRPAKQPFLIRDRTSSSLAIAGIYASWRVRGAGGSGAAAGLATGERLWTCAMITTTATDEVGHLHDRMPMLVGRDSWSAWLDGTSTDPDRLLALLVPAAPGRLEAYPVSREVNDVRRNGPHLAVPLPDAQRWHDEVRGVTAGHPTLW